MYLCLSLVCGFCFQVWSVSLIPFKEGMQKGLVRACANGGRILLLNGEILASQKWFVFVYDKNRWHKDVKKNLAVACFIRCWAWDKYLSLVDFGGANIWWTIIYIYNQLITFMYISIEPKCHVKYFTWIPLLNSRAWV